MTLTKRCFFEKNQDLNANSCPVCCAQEGWHAENRAKCKWIDLDSAGPWVKIHLDLCFRPAFFRQFLAEQKVASVRRKESPRFKQAYNYSGYEVPLFTVIPTSAGIPFVYLS